MAVDYLEMAADTLRDNIRDGDGPERPLMALGLALVALVERVELLVALAVRSVTATEEIVASLERHRWAMLTPDEKEAASRAGGLIPAELGT